MDRLKKILELLGIDKLESDDQILVQEHLQSLLEDMAGEQGTITRNLVLDQSQVEELAKYLNDASYNDQNEILEDTKNNVLPIANKAASALNDSDKPLASLMLCVLSEVTGVQKFASLAQRLAADTSKNESNENMSKLKNKISIDEFYKEQVENSKTDCESLYEFIQDKSNYPGIRISVYEKFEIYKNAGETQAKDVWSFLNEQNEKKLNSTIECKNCGCKFSVNNNNKLKKCPDCGENHKSTNDGFGFNSVESEKELNESPFKTDLQNYQSIWNQN